MQVIKAKTPVVQSLKLRNAATYVTCGNTAELHVLVNVLLDEYNVYIPTSQPSGQAAGGNDLVPPVRVDELGNIVNEAEPVTGNEQVCCLSSLIRAH